MKKGFRMSRLGSNMAADGRQSQPMAAFQTLREAVWVGIGAKVLLKFDSSMTHATRAQWPLVSSWKIKAHKSKLLSSPNPSLPTLQ